VRLSGDNPYRRATWTGFEALLKPLAPVRRALDFGAGDGWYSQQVEAAGLAREVLPVDVMARDEAYRKAQIYDGGVLPFADRSFDLCYAIDVLHHCADPVRALSDMARCSARYLVIKDHRYASALGKATLALLDEAGNRRFGVRSRYLYQRDWEWLPLLEAAGFSLTKLVHPFAAEPRPWGRWTNRLQFLGLWTRVETP
jgi:SAM-dependent methyltransferase